MANIKITDLDAYANPDSTDVLPIVDVGADETKKVSIADLMENAGAGTEALPGIAFGSDPDTGIYRPAADQLAISTGGAQRILVDDSGVVTIAGDLTVNGTTTTVNSTTLTVDDKNIELGSVGTPTDTTADGGGITLKGATDKTINWVNATDAWTSSERFDFPAGTQGAPSIILNGDIDSGIYQPGADQIAISTNGQGRLFVDASGNVGINRTPTNSANYTTLDLSGTNGSQILLNRTGSLDAFFYSSNGLAALGAGSGSALALYTNSSGSTNQRLRITSNGEFEFIGAGTAGTTEAVYFSGSAPVNSLVIDSSGNVGLGTIAPTEVLTVSKAGGANVFPLHIQNTQNWGWGVGLKLRQRLSNGGDVTDSAAIVSDWNGDNNSTLEFSTVTSGSLTEKVRIDSSGTFRVKGAGTAGSTDAVQLNGSAPANSLLLDASGRLGIGANSPGYRLDVKSPGNGQFFINGQNSSGTNIFQVYESSTGDGQNGMLYLYDGAGNNDVKISTNGASWFNGGSLGIGTNSPGSYNANYDDLVIANSGNAGITIATGTSNYAVIAFADGTTGSEAYRGFIQYLHSNDDLIFGSAGFDRARFDNSGRFLIGTNIARTNIDYAFGTTGSQLQIEQANATTNLSIVQNYDSGTTSAPAILTLARSGATSVGSTAIVANGNRVGEINFSGSDGTDFTVAACIRGEVDGTPGSNDMPGRLVFSTNSGSPSTSPTERMRIDSGGTTIFKGNTTNPVVRVSGISGGDSNYSVDIKHPSTSKIDFVQRWFTSSQQEQIVLSFGSGNLFSLVTYSTVVGGTNRDLYIDNAGLIGYVSSTRNSKDNITAITDTAWINQLNPVSFNRRKLDEDKQYTDELYSELEYGLIAEEVEQVAPELCFYDEVDGEQELRGVHYSKLISPMLKALQQANARIETLEARLAALEAN